MILSKTSIPIGTPVDHEGQRLLWRKVKLLPKGVHQIKKPLSQIMEIVIVPDINWKAENGMNKIHMQDLFSKPRAYTPSPLDLMCACVMLAMRVIVKITAMVDVDHLPLIRHSAFRTSVEASSPRAIGPSVERMIKRL